MSFVKTISDSVGTAAGVACPLFGILFASLSLQIGGTIAVALGSASIFLLGFIALAMLYVTYEKNKEEQLAIAQKTTSYLTEFIENYCQLLRLNNMNDLNLISFLKRCAKHKDEYKFQLKFIEFIKKKYPTFLKNYPYSDQEFNNLVIEEIIREFNDSKSLKKLIKSPPWTTIASSFFISAAGVFGAIAGTSAGIMGILMGLGVTTGFAAIPPLGIAILVLAAVTALCVAIHSVHGIIEKNQKTLLFKSFKHFNNSYGDGFDLSFSKENNEFFHNFKSNRLKHNFEHVSATIPPIFDTQNFAENRYNFS